MVAWHGRSMEEEVRRILDHIVNQDDNIRLLGIGQRLTILAASQVKRLYGQ